MPIPNKTTFGPTLDDFNTGISFEEIRKLTDDNDKIRYLKRRLECFLLKQVDEFADRSKAYSPFPLTIITCVAAETLGRIIFPVTKLEQEGKRNQIPKIVSVKIYGMLDKELNRQIDKTSKDLMKKILPKKTFDEVTCYADLFHVCLRTSYIHGFRPQNVFLDADARSGWGFGEGALVINPYWFWREYKRVFNECFDLILNAKENNNPYRLNALDYFNRLINE